LTLGAIATAVVLYGTLSAHDPLPTILPFQQDKVEHAGAFFVLGGLFSWRSRLWGMVRCALALTGLAIAIEILQGLLTTTRQPSLEDVGAGLIGLALGLTLARALGSRAVRSPRAPAGA
jgi:VanZ family protein